MVQKKLREPVFYKVAAGTPLMAKALSARITAELTAGKEVLWLLTGGSSIHVTVDALRQIPKELLEHLTLALGDERYGPFGHPNSNLKQLVDAGLNPSEFTVINVLEPKALRFEATRTRYEERMRAAFQKATVIIAQFGMGADGHIAGILPNSPAVAATGIVAAYEAPPYKRITITFPALRKVAAAYLFVFGDDRRTPLERLQTEDAPLAEQPAQIIKELPEAYVYNDQIGEAP